MYTVAVTDEHAKVLDRPPHCGPRTRKKTVMTECVSTKPCSRTLTSTTSASPAPISSCAAEAVDDHLSVKLLNIEDRSRPSSADSPSSSTTTTRKRESARSDTSGGSMESGETRSLRRAVTSIDNVDLWEDSSDSEVKVLTAAASVDNDEEQQPAKRAKERHRCNRRHKHHLMPCRSSRHGDACWRRPSVTQATPAAAAAGINDSCIPSIIESCGRPATANRSAMDLSRGSVELRQRRPGVGPNVFIRGMQLLLTADRHHAVTKSDVRITPLNEITSPQHQCSRQTTSDFV